MGGHFPDRCAPGNSSNVAKGLSHRIGIGLDLIAIFKVGMRALIVIDTRRVIDRPASPNAVPTADAGRLGATGKSRLPVSEIASRVKLIPLLFGSGPSPTIGEPDGSQEVAVFEFNKSQIATLILATRLVGSTHVPISAAVSFRRQGSVALGMLQKNCGGQGIAKQ